MAEHHIFSDALDATWLYVRHCRAALEPAAWPPTPVPEPNEAIKSIDMTRYSADLDMTNPFHPTGFRRHIDGYMPSLVEHLRDEIDTLAPDLIEPMGQQADDELKKIVQSHLRGYDPKWFLCSAFSESVKPTSGSPRAPLSSGRHARGVSTPLVFTLRSHRNHADPAAPSRRAHEHHQAAHGTALPRPPDPRSGESIVPVPFRCRHTQTARSSR